VLCGTYFKDNNLLSLIYITKISQLGKKSHVDRCHSFSTFDLFPN